MPFQDYRFQTNIMKHWGEGKKKNTKQQHTLQAVLPKCAQPFARTVLQSLRNSSFLKCSSMRSCSCHTAGKAKVEMRTAGRSPRLMASTPSSQAAGPQPWWVLFNTTFAPFPCAKQVHFPPPSANMSSVIRKEQRAGKLFSWAPSITWIDNLFGDTHTTTCCLHQREAGCCKQGVYTSSQTGANPSVKSSAGMSADQQAREWLGRTQFNRVRRY